MSEVAEHGTGIRDSELRDSRRIGLEAKMENPIISPWEWTFDCVPLFWGEPQERAGADDHPPGRPWWYLPTVMLLFEDGTVFSSPQFGSHACECDMPTHVTQGRMFYSGR